MRKEITRLNEVIGKGWIGKIQSNDKKMINQKGHNLNKECIPQSSMGLDTQKEPKQMEEE